MDLALNNLQRLICHKPNNQPTMYSISNYLSIYLSIYRKLSIKSGMGGANCSTDHVMIKSTTQLLVRHRIRKDKIPIRKLTANTIKINRVKDNLQASLNDKLTEILPVNVEEEWNHFKSIKSKVSKEKFGTTVRNHEDWFGRNSIELEELIKNRNLARNNILSKNPKSLKARYRTCSQLLWPRCRQLHWLECSPKARETGVQSQVESYQRLKKWYLIPPRLTLSIIRYRSRVKWSNPGKGGVSFPTHWCSSLLVTHDYSRQLHSRQWQILMTQIFFLPKSCVSTKSEPSRTTASSRQQINNHRNAQASCQVEGPFCYIA